MSTVCVLDFVWLWFPTFFLFICPKPLMVIIPLGSWLILDSLLLFWSALNSKYMDDSV